MKDTCCVELLMNGEDSQIIGESKARVWVERNGEFVNLGLKGQGHREVKGLGFSLRSNDAIKGFLFCLDKCH